MTPKANIFIGKKVSNALSLTARGKKGLKSELALCVFGARENKNVDMNGDSHGCIVAVQVRNLSKNQVVKGGKRKRFSKFKCA